MSTFHIDVLVLVSSVSSSNTGSSSSCSSNSSSNVVDITATVVTTTTATLDFCLSGHFLELLQISLDVPELGLLYQDFRAWMSFLIDPN